MTRRTPLIIAPALPAFVIGLAALTLGSAAASYRLGHDAGRIEGRIEGRAAAYHQTDRVLRDLEHALAPLAQVSRQAETHAAEGRHTENGDAP